MTGRRETNTPAMEAAARGQSLGAVTDERLDPGSLALGNVSVAPRITAALRNASIKLEKSLDCRLGYVADNLIRLAAEEVAAVDMETLAGEIAALAGQIDGDDSEVVRMAARLEEMRAMLRWKAA